MTLKTSPSLDTILADAATKLERATRIATALGNTRRVRCWRDANASAADPHATGTEFLNVGSTGTIEIVAGDINGLGVLSGTTIQLAADLATGASVLRIEGNGHWIEGDLGLTGSGKYFNFNANPTTGVGVGIKRAGLIKSPGTMDSGTGLVSPTIKSTTPTVIELEDWTDPANPVVVGTANLTRRLDNWVYERPAMAAEIGDVALYTVDEPIKWHPAGKANQAFEFGGLLFVAPNYNTENGVQQLEQVLLSFKPLDRWATYPFADTYVKAEYTATDTSTWPITYGPCTNPTTADLTYPPPFKAHLKNAAGDILFTHEIKAFNDKPAGAINGPQWSQKWNYEEPIINHFNCAMMLPWQNMRTRKSSKAGNYFNGVNPYCYSNRAAKGIASSNAVVPNFSMGQDNGLNHFYWMPPYPMKRTVVGDTYYPDGSYTQVPNPYKTESLAYLAAYDTGPVDPDIGAAQRLNTYPQDFRVTGYKYQPGSQSGHDWRTGLGGVRFDRNVLPHILAIWAGNPTWVRPQGNVPIRDMVEDWGMAFFNHSNHWIRDLKTFESLPKDKTLAGTISFYGAYYGRGPSGPEQSIDLCGVYQSDPRSSLHEDATGRLPYGGWQRDNLHAYTNAAWYAILLNSPMHAFAAAHDFQSVFPSGLGQSYPDSDPASNGDTGQYAPGFFMVRSHAWRWLNYGLQWMVATPHARGVSSAETESNFQLELETMYDKVFVPAFIENDQRPYFVSVRNLGAPAKNDGWNNFKTPGGSLCLYLGPMLMVLKQFGLLSVMKAKNAKCKAVIDMVIACLDKITIDYILDTDMRDAYYPYVTVGEEITAANVPANWAAQKIMLDTKSPTFPANTPNPRDNGEREFKNFTLRYDNTYGEQYGCAHMYLQYLKIRKIFFTEYPHARLDAAITKMNGYYAAHDAARTATEGAWNFLYPNYGEILPPDVVGPL